MLGMEGRMMRNVAIVAAASRQEEKMLDTEVELMIPLISEVKQQAGLDQAEIGFTCSGSSDFLAGQAFLQSDVSQPAGRASTGRYKSYSGTLL